jgi:hypothetical protein
LQALTTLRVNDNLLDGRVPYGIGRTITTLRIDDNQFTGSLQDHVMTWVVYKELGVTGNRWWGKMPKFFNTPDAYTDIGSEETLGEFLRNGESCAGDEVNECSSGEDTCAPANAICCSVDYGNAGGQAPCASGMCEEGTGACLNIATLAPTLANWNSTSPQQGDDEQVTNLLFGIGSATAVLSFVAISVQYKKKKLRKRAAGYGAAYKLSDATIGTQLATRTRMSSQNPLCPTVEVLGKKQRVPDWHRNTMDLAEGFAEESGRTGSFVDV